MWPFSSEPKPVPALFRINPASGTETHPYSVERRVDDFGPFCGGAFHYYRLLDLFKTREAALAFIQRIRQPPEYIE